MIVIQTYARIRNSIVTFLTTTGNNIVFLRRSHKCEGMWGDYTFPVTPSVNIESISDKDYPPVPTQGP